MNYKYILAETAGNVGIITLNRPKALNALSTPLLAEVRKALQSFEADDAIGAIVITGSEKAFAAGADIREMQDKGFVDCFQADFPDGPEGAWSQLAVQRKPVIAAVAGYALGGGCELAMACDFILAADNAKFGQPEISLGTMPGAGGTQRLTRLIGRAKAMEMCLTGRFMDAAEAERSGLVSRVIPLNQLRDEAIKTAAKIADMSRPAVVMIKEAVNRVDEASLSDGIRFERRLFHSTFATEDQKEGMKAFVEKRKPNFKNR